MVASPPSKSGTLIIPGRVQSRDKNEDDSYRAAAGYRLYVENVAGNCLPSVVFKENPVALWLTLYYVSESASVKIKPLIWHHQNIPRADKAPNIILGTLSGYLYTHAGQVNPLTVERCVISPGECFDRFGSREGAAVVRWQGG